MYPISGQQIKQIAAQLYDVAFKTKVFLEALKE
jgi:hypothetical protein